MIPQDYHLHSRFSCDCHATMVEMCRAAIEQGISEIGFTEHFDLIPDDPCYRFFKADAWWRELDRCRETFAGVLTIRAGIELGEPHRFPEEVRALLEGYPWDYALGSLHWVGDWLIFDEDYFDQPEEEAYGAYFEELERMVQSGLFQVLAHMDVIKRRGVRRYGPFNPRAYEEPIRRVLRACVEHGVALEINTSSLRRGMKQTTPPRQVFEWFREEGGRWVTLGSDAHRPSQVGFGLDRALGVLRAAGFQDLACFERGTPQPLPIPQAG